MLYPHSEVTKCCGTIKEPMFRFLKEPLEVLHSYQGMELFKVLLKTFCLKSVHCSPQERRTIVDGPVCCESLLQ